MILRRRDASNAAGVKNHDVASVNGDRSNLLDTICWLRLKPSHVVSQISIGGGYSLLDSSELSDGELNAPDFGNVQRLNLVVRFSKVRERVGLTNCGRWFLFQFFHFFRSFASLRVVKLLPLSTFLQF